ncbi:MAG: AbrB/MazE/SpoVT family DNA-binding domain-containing protein [Burkholderiaceae bacterium]
MNLVKLGKKGQVSIPQGVLRQLGITAEAPLLVETSDDGAIVLRPVSVHPVEVYSGERLAEFERENAMTPAQSRAFAPQLADFDAWLKAAANAVPRPLRVAQPPATFQVSPKSPRRSAMSKPVAARRGTKR